MRKVTVAMIDADHGEHTLTIEANSLFDACRQAVRHWTMLSYNDPGALLTLRAGKERWYGQQKSLQKPNP